MFRRSLRVNRDSRAFNFNNNDKNFKLTQLKYKHSEHFKAQLLNGGDAHESIKMWRGGQIFSEDILRSYCQRFTKKLS